MIDAAIFDSDGTLIDSLALHWRCECDVLRSYGLEVTPEKLLAFTGRNEKDWLAQLKRDAGAAFDIDEVRAAFTARKRVEASGVAFMPGVEELLDDLRSRGVKLAVATGSARAFFEEVRAALGLDRWFDAYVTSDETGRGKPAPDIFLEAARRLDVPIERCAIFEDGAIGLQAARASGAKVIAYKNAHGPADLRIGHFSEIDAERLQSF